MNKITIFFIGLLWGMFIVLGIQKLANNTYKDGQIDALTGKIQFKLITNPDSSRAWVYIE